MTTGHRPDLPAVSPKLVNAQVTERVRECPHLRDRPSTCIRRSCGKGHYKTSYAAYVRTKRMNQSLSSKQWTKSGRRSRVRTWSSRLAQSLNSLMYVTPRLEHFVSKMWPWKAGYARLRYVLGVLSRRGGHVIT